MDCALLFVLSMFLTASAEAQDVEHDRRWWFSQTEAFQSLYVTGFYDGLRAGHELSASAKTEPSTSSHTFELALGKYFLNLTEKQIVDAVSRFYQDDRNRSIRVAWAIDTVVRELAGENVTSRIKDYRRRSVKRIRSGPGDQAGVVNPRPPNAAAALRQNQ